MNAALQSDWHALVLANEAMAKHTTWRVGGPAQHFFKPQNLTQLQTFMAETSADEVLTWVGLGSNLLVRDGGIRGTVIATQYGLKGLQALGQGRYRIEAGLTSARMARQAQQDGFAAGAFLAGIPGTMGGALAMNAGAFGAETWRFVESVEVMDRRGAVRTRQAEEFEVGYRSVSIADNHWFVGAIMDFSRVVVDPQNIRALLQKRNSSQPIGEPSCGSVFRNPEGDYAARLIEAAGLKGHPLGGAQVSEKHANFIINTGTAKASDIEQLMTLVQEEVEQKFGVRLQTEVRTVGVAEHV